MPPGASQISATVSDYTNWSLSAFLLVALDMIIKANILLIWISGVKDLKGLAIITNRVISFQPQRDGRSQEGYLKNFFINKFKLRASYGKSGDSVIGYFDSFGIIISIPDLSNYFDYIWIAQPKKAYNSFAKFHIISCQNFFKDIIFNTKEIPWSKQSVLPHCLH